MSQATWSFYDPATGLFVGRTFSGPSGSIAANTPDGYAAIEGNFDHLSRRVDVERLARDHAAARERHLTDVEAARAAFEPGEDVMGQVRVFAEPTFEFHAGPEHIVDWQPPQPSPDHEWSEATRRWMKRADVIERERRAAQRLAEIQTLEVKGVRAQRELILDPTDAEARRRLTEINTRILQLRAD